MTEQMKQEMFAQNLKNMGIAKRDMTATKKQLEELKSRVCKNTMVADHQWCLFCPFSVVGHDDNEICTIQHTIDKLDDMIERVEEV